MNTVCEVSAPVLVASNDHPKEFRPFCPKCGWRMGGVDSWDGQRCKCGNSAGPIQLQTVPR